MPKDRLTATFLVLALIAVIAAVAFGFVKLGSPAHQRDVQADTKRVNDLSAIAQNIYNYMNPGPTKIGITSPEIPRLPATLDALPLYGQSYKDPVTGAPYEYKPQGGNGYQLCATFSLVAAEDETNQNYYYGPRIFAVHPAGYYCFSLDASKSPYETVPPVPMGITPKTAPIPAPVR